ncbi:DNA repair protein, partial [Streptococcus suis]
MDVKNLRKLKRIELYEIMLAQSEEIDCLRNQLEKIKTELADRRIMISQSGSIAEASMKLTNIFEEAQKAAD